MKNTKSKVVVYIHRTDRMRKAGRKKFLKQERPRIEVSINGKMKFMYADEFMQHIVNEFRYR